MSSPSVSSRSKDEWRAVLAGLAEDDGPPRHTWGRLAQLLRGLPAYRAARRLFVAPSPVLAQVRINVLLDGKELLMPAPGLKDGFYLCRPFTIPFGDLAYATTYRGLSRFAQLLDNRAVGKAPVDMLVTGVVAVDPRGGRLGSGKGFFDLACALLAELHVYDPGRAEVWGVAGDVQMVPEELPVEPWDVVLDGVITPADVHRFAEGEPRRVKIYWDCLPLERFRRMNPFWKLYQGRQTGGAGREL